MMYVLITRIDLINLITLIIRAGLSIRHRLGVGSLTRKLPNSNKSMPICPCSKTPLVPSPLFSLTFTRVIRATRITCWVSFDDDVRYAESNIYIYICMYVSAGWICTGTAVTHCIREEIRSIEQEEKQVDMIYSALSKGGWTNTGSAVQLGA